MEEISPYAIVTKTLSLGDAMEEAEKVIKKQAFVAADLPIINHVYRTNPEIKEYLDSHPVDAYSSLGFQLLMKRPIVEVSHFPQQSWVEVGEKMKYRNILENPPNLGRSYTTRITPVQEDEFFEVLKKLLVGGRDSSFSLSDEFLEKKATPFADISELCLEDKIVQPGSEHKRFLLLDPKLLQ